MFYYWLTIQFMITDNRLLAFWSGTVLLSWTRIETRIKITAIPLRKKPQKTLAESWIVGNDCFCKNHNFCEQQLNPFLTSKSNLEFKLEVNTLTLLVGRREEHLACKNWVMECWYLACKNWVMGCWCGYLTGARCRLFTCGPADATASQNPIFSCVI